jgi:hypothetical protein
MTKKAYSRPVLTCHGDAVACTQHNRLGWWYDQYGAYAKYPPGE